LAGAFGRFLLALFEAVGVALDGHDLGVVHQAVNERDDAAGVGERLVPLGEGTVAREQERLLAVASADDLEEQVGVVRAVGEV
jgi:hypothetical protein